MGGGHDHAGAHPPPYATFVERTLASIENALERADAAEDLARRDGLLQSLDPRAKTAGMLVLVVAGIFAHKLEAVLCVFAIAVALAVASRVSLWIVALRAWIGVFLFTGAVALPALVLTPGVPILRVAGLNVTYSGVFSAAMLLARAETSATLALLVVLTTPWSHVLKALWVLGVPTVALVILLMTHRYVFLLLGAARDMFEARRSRTVGKLEPAARRRMAASAAGVLLAKTLALGGEVHLAMISRGFRGDAFTIDEFRMRRRDWATVTGSVAVLAAVLVFGR